MGELADRYRAHFDAWTRGDMEAALAYIDDDIVWHPNRSMKPVRGKTAMRAFLEKFGAGMSEKRYEQTLMIEQGDMLVVEASESYVKNGKRVTVHYAGFVKWRNGKAIEWRDYFDMRAVERQLAA